MKYYRYGKDKGSLRFKCKECNRTFTEYSGTWLSGIHKKYLVNNYNGVFPNDITGKVDSLFKKSGSATTGQLVADRLDFKLLP